MRYYAQIGANEYVVDIDDAGVQLNGAPVDIDLERSGIPELYSLLFGGRSHELLIEANRFNYTITLRGEQFQVQVEDERMRRLSANRRLVLPEGEIAVTAPIPGLVVKVLIAEGEEIEEEQPLVILEAMKMENEIRARRPGRIKQVKVAPGQRVEQNAVLLVIE
jgi:biotin carboxyl carrier protein